MINITCLNKQNGIFVDDKINVPRTCILKTFCDIFIKIWQGVYFTGTLLCQCVQKFGGRGWRSYQSSRGTASGIRLVGVAEGIIISLVGVAGRSYQNSCGTASGIR